MSIRAIKSKSYLNLDFLSLVWKKCYVKKISEIGSEWKNRFIPVRSFLVAYLEITSLCTHHWHVAVNFTSREQSFRRGCFWTTVVCVLRAPANSWPDHTPCSCLRAKLFLLNFTHFLSDPVRISTSSPLTLLCQALSSIRLTALKWTKFLWLCSRKLHHQ